MFTTFGLVEGLATSPEIGTIAPKLKNSLVSRL